VNRTDDAQRKLRIARGAFQGVQCGVDFHQAEAPPH
jgi:hypothetical protein